MSKIKLQSALYEKIAIGEKPIIITNSKNGNGYLTTRGFVSFGNIFTEIYNQIIESIEDSETQVNSIGNSYAWDCVQGVNLSDIITLFKTGKLPPLLKAEIESNTKILPFRVGIYKNKPTLYFIGFEDDLFLYDLLMIYNHKIKIKLCTDCKRAFVPTTKDIYCSSCKDLSLRNRAKYERLKKDPARLKYTRIQQRIKNRNDSENYRFLFERLAVENKNIDWLERWDTLDKRYQQIKKNCIEIKLTNEQWNENIKAANLQSIDDFSSWLDLQAKEVNSL